MKNVSLVVTILVAGICFAQPDRPSIVGIVVDQSGARVANTQIFARNLDTNTITRCTTNSLGLYSLLNLSTGKYTLTFARDGFATLERNEITLHLSETLNLDVSLVVGAQSEVIAVHGSPPILQTESSDLSVNLTNGVVESLPLNVEGGRSLSTFMFDFVPGVEGDDYDSHIMGSLSKTKEVMIDGTSAVAQIGGYLSESQPPMESVDEFQVTTAGTRARDGRTGGGVFRYNLKSGSNQWHGSGLLYLHNETLDANSWSNNYHGFARPDDRLYDYAASLGGPIFKNKTFFYAAWERYTFANYGLGGLGSTVPTTAFLNGDFSTLLDTTRQIGTDSGGNPVYQGAIIDPATGLAFPGNIIPQDRFSPISRKIIDIYKSDYAPLAPGLTNNNALPSNVAPWHQSNAFSIKLDHNVSDTHRIAASFIDEVIPRLLADQGGVWAPGSTDGGPFANVYDHRTTAPSVRISDSYAISSHLLNVLTATFNRYRNPRLARSNSGNWSSTLGLGNFGSGNFPVIGFQGIDGTQFRSAADGTPIYEGQIGSHFDGFYAANTFIFGDNLSWTRGRHTFTFGSELRAMQLNSHGDSGVPAFTFDPSQTAGTFGSNAGFGFASFLLGDVNQASVSTPNNMYGRRKSLSLYATDDFRVSPKLTLNLDLRWDFNGRYHEKYGHWSNFDTTMINPATGQPGALEFATGGSDSFERKQYYHNFSGGIGGAYQLNQYTVLHAAFDVFYVPLNLNFWSGVPYGFNPGYTSSNRYLTPFSWDSGYPGQPVDIGKDPNYITWGMVTIDPRSLELGNSQQWSVGIERELPKSIRLDVNLFQSHSYHLESGYLAGNQPNLSQYSQVTQAGQAWDWVSTAGFSGYKWASLAPFPNLAASYSPLFYVNSPLGNSDYSALIVDVEKRTSSGLSFEVSYNYSSSHSDTDTSFEELWWLGPLQDVYNLPQERHTVSPFDMTHVVKGYVNYDLPFGRGKVLLGGAGDALNALVGGWTVSSGFRYNSGTPVRITANTWYPGINTVYANIAPNCDLNANFNGQVGGAYFNKDCFSNPDYGSFGNAPGYLTNLRYPGTAVEDIGLNKSLSFGERYHLSLRVQMFNVFNRHRFAGPNTTIGDPRFGTVPPENLNGANPRVGQVGVRFTF